MEVILLERVDKLGNMGDVVDVKNGFGRNFLLPQARRFARAKPTSPALKPNVRLSRLATKTCAVRPLTKRRRSTVTSSSSSAPHRMPVRFTGRCRPATLPIC